MRHKILLAEMDMTRVSDALPRDAKSPFRFCTARAIPDSMARSSKLREATPQGVTSLITCAYFSWTWGLSSRMTLAETRRWQCTPQRWTRGSRRRRSSQRCLFVNGPLETPSESPCCNVRN